jgi:hypothetical protein
MLSSQKRKNAETEAIEANSRIQAQFGPRIKRYISALIACNSIYPDSYAYINIKDHILYLKSLDHEIYDAARYHWPLSVYRNEQTLSHQCAFYDQLMQTIALKISENQTKEKLLIQFEARINKYIRNLSDYIDICDLIEKDPTEHTRMTAYKTDLKNILAMLRSQHESLYTDEVTLSRDCAHLDELMRTTVKPKTDEGMALRASLRTQYQGRMDGLIARLSFLNEKVHNERSKNLIQNTQIAYLDKLRNNYGIIPDSAELESACTNLEERLNQLENQETASAAPGR